jgi:hypothetical protein
MMLRVFGDGSTKILGAWESITHAGAFYEHHKLNPKGAFHVALGYQACHVLGTYHNDPALIQVDDIVGTRDASEDFKREGPTVKGEFGVHHHWANSTRRRVTSGEFSHVSWHGSVWPV